MHSSNPGNAADLAFTSARELASLLRRRKIGAEELLDVFLDRVEQLNPAINAVVALDPEGARGDARAAEALLAKGEGGPLCGLPMTVKDTFRVAGMPVTCGIPALADFVPAEDALAVERLKAAGAIVFGKTNVPMAGADHQTFNPVYGLTRNPWDLERTPGGSSGGAAAALAIGLTPLELGSDIGGSIRIPSHFCGVFGHKPSYGLVPARGHIPPMPGMLSEAELAVNGPMARSATDLELALDILAGADPVQGPGVNLFVPRSRHERLDGFRIAIVTGNFPYPADRETQAAMTDLAARLRAAGAIVDESARPEIDFGEAFETYLGTLFSIVLAGQPFALSPQERDGLPTDAQRLGKMLERCSRHSYGDWHTLAEGRARLRNAWHRIFQTCDALICPVFPTTAFPHDPWGEGLAAQLHRRRQVDDEDIVYLEQLAWPGLATAANLPATAVPLPRAPGQLPLGVQIVGPAFEDRTPLRLAQLMELELNCRAVPPPTLPATES